MIIETKEDFYLDAYKKLREAKIQDTLLKTQRNGYTDEDDYNTHIPPEGFNWSNIPTHSDGMFYGFRGCADNFYKLCDVMPPYVSKYNPLAGGMYYFLGRLRTGKTEDGGWNPDYDYAPMFQEICNKYDIYHGIGQPQHLCPDLTIGLALGWGGLLDKIRAFAKQENLTKDQQDFYYAEERVVLGIQLWMRHTIEEVRRLLDAEQDALCRKNLQEMLECNEYLIENRPRTLREACQFIAWFCMASRSYNRDGAGGQLDELLRPYYEKDIAGNSIDDEDATFYIAGLLNADTRYYQIGGPDKTGRDMTSKVSFLILEACDRLNVTANITIRVHEQLDQNLFDKGVEYLIKHKNAWPRFSGDKALCEGFMRNGYSIELARERIAVGCNWMALPGREYTINDCIKINLARCFEIAFDEMMESTGEKSTQVLFQYFKKHIGICVEIVSKAIDYHLLYQKYNLPEILLNLMCHGAIEKGLDVSDGGIEFYNIGVDGSGNAVVADSFAALEQRVEVERRTTFLEVYTQLKNNYPGESGELFRRMMRTSERYGQGGSLGDKWAIEITKIFTDAIVKNPTPKKGAKMIPGLFSWSYTVRLGKTVGATPNGRRAGEPINHGANPLPGFRKDGAVTAQSTAIASVQCGYGNTAPFQLELDPSITNIQDGVKKIGSLLKTHFDLGGTLVNINILDKEKLFQAHQNPSLYPDLVVRVTGFTAYFSTLSPEFRQLVVDRLLTS